MKLFGKFSRRGLLKGAAGVAGGIAASNLLSTGGSLIPGTAFGQVAPEKPALLLVFLNGGYNAVFPSADSFAGAGTFGVTAGNQLALGNGLVVDNTFNTMPAFAKTHMASIGIRHGLSSHGAAQQADLTTGTRSYLLMLAAAMGGDAAIKAAVLGNTGVPGVKPPENGVSLQTIADMKTTIAALGGATTDPTIPDRNTAASGLVASRQMSQNRLLQSPVQLTSVKEAYDTSIQTLQKPVQPFDYTALATAYGMAATATAVTSFTSKMVAAELMITAGANVCIAMDGGWDTHGDTSANNVRNMMTQRILPPLNTFMNRMLNQAGRNVVVAIMGDFSRSLPGSDHQANLTASVMGRYVRVGTTGKTAANVSLPAGTPSVPGFWAYLAAALKVPSQPFGANPHGLVL